LDFEIHTDSKADPALHLMQALHHLQKKFSLPGKSFQLGSFQFEEASHVLLLTLSITAFADFYYYHIRFQKCANLIRSIFVMMEEKIFETFFFVDSYLYIAAGAGVQVNGCFY
jgi:hypothetical protein